MSRARASLAYLPDMSRDSLRGFAHLGLLATLLQSFLSIFFSRRFAPVSGYDLGVFLGADDGLFFPSLVVSAATVLVNSSPL